MARWRDTIGYLVRRLKCAPVARSAEEQQRIEAATRQLALYRFRGCPYCAVVTRAIRRLGLDIEIRDTLLHPKWARELLREGGKNQVPCLRIEEEGGAVTWMYESADIVAYLRTRFG